SRKSKSGFPIFLTPTIQSSLSSNPGSPLTDDEYKVFFSSLSPTWKANLVCQIRRNKGCHDPKIIELDQFENHGQIPEGPICTELPQSPHFETFCVFAQFRCLNQKFYTKGSILYNKIKTVFLIIPPLSCFFFSCYTSLLAIDKDEALVILCYAVLQDILRPKDYCQNLSFVLILFPDLCPECAFCSLKTEQCQGASNLKRTHCSDGIFTNYINPGILAQHRSSPNLQEFYGFETYGGMRTEYWCGRLAAHGCDDYRVALWLQSEYSFFHGGDFPEKICDSTGVQHPTYCAFKSNQCMEYTIRNKKVRTVIFLFWISTGHQ
uniref:Acrosin-binding protein n=1 Tax=Pseudonaja textilis TaxID=8673 RepID=A0A670ZYD7_PSETE